ncbi:MAG: 3-deoxy-D-manno-octulosonic acid transferase [Deltaproteobacteria bacterium]|nr:3-deoxy-D-manno-octulosonic acid transferase [Deltaproteobacteria bacterium]
MKYRLYNILVHLALPFLLPYLFLRMIKGKTLAGIWERFGIVDKGKLQRLSRHKVVWFHAVSVGETKTLMPLARLFKKRHPEAGILFSTVTATGRDVLLKEAQDLVSAVIYLPFDVSWAVGRLIRLTRPCLFVVAEKEVWPNLFYSLKRNDVPIVVVNGAISERSYKRYRFFAFLFKDVFSMVSCYCAKTDIDLERALMLGVEKDKTGHTGNLKFDMEIVPRLEDDAGLVHAIGGEPLLVAGSTHDGEEEIIIRVYKRLKREFPCLRLVIAPRHPERFEKVSSLLREGGTDFAKRTVNGRKDVCLLDTVGELSRVYALSTISFVGGSLIPVGGHNLMEPAYFAKPVLYGHYISSALQMAELLEANGAGARVRDEEDLYDNLRRLLKDPESAILMGKKGRSVVEANRGATERCLLHMERFF